MNNTTHNVDPQKSYKKQRRQNMRWRNELDKFKKYWMIERSGKSWGRSMSNDGRWKTDDDNDDDDDDDDDEMCSFSDTIRKSSIELNYKRGSDNSEMDEWKQIINR